MPLWFVPLASAQQEASYVSELHFVHNLRARHYNDLALEYLERLKKNNPSPELLQELPLELAETRLETAASEPDSGKRVAIYEQARSEIEAFLNANKNHPRAGEAKLDIARVVVLQGKTQLSRALMQDSLEGKVAEGHKARQQFVDAAALLKTASDEIDALLAKSTGKSQAQMRKLQNDHLQAQLAIALNSLDQARTYLDESKDEVLIERGKKVQEAIRLLKSLAAEDATNPICGQANAWLGLCLYENGDPPKARSKLNDVINDRSPAASDARRLARYFRLLIQNEMPLPEEKNNPGFLSILINEANNWVVDYPAYTETPEGYGLLYLYARLLQRRANEPGERKQQKEWDLTRARHFLKEIERTENDFTDRARRLKIAIVKEQGGFSKDITTLSTFEDCYLRAQYEIIQMGEDAKSNDKKIEETHKAHVAKIIAALQRGLTLPDAKPEKGKAIPEVNNAKAMLTFYYLDQQKFREAIEFGEGFARDDPRSGAAAMSAVYALQAYAQMLGKRERENALQEELRPDQEKMLALAKYMEERWPRELAGDVARHQIALTLLHEQKQARQATEQVRLLGAAADKLGSIGKNYASHVVAQYQLADAYLQAEKDNLDPLPGKKPGDYHQQAIALLTALPEPDTAAGPLAGQLYAMGKSKLAWELFKDKQFEAMLKTGEDLSKKMPALPMEEGIRQSMLANVVDIQLFATASLAEVDLNQARYSDVVAKLDPFVAALSGSDASPDTKLIAAELKKNLQLGSVLLSMDLRANVQLGQLDRVEKVLEALRSLSADGNDKSSTTRILQTLVFVIKQQIDELDKKDDKESKENAIAGFTKILDKVVAKPNELEISSRLLLAQCYANMEQHEKAIELLEKVATPDEKGAQLLYARELRQAKNLEKARQVVNEILGTSKAPGWGAHNIDAQIEDVALMEREGKYGNAAHKADDLVRKLLPKITRDNNIKEKYLEAYYHVVYSFVKYGQSQTDKNKKDKAFKQAAAQTLELNKKWPDYGSDTSAKRFNDLLSKEKELKDAVARLKAGNK